MGYIVWSKAEHEEWRESPAEDLAEAKGLVLENRIVGRDVRLCQEIEYTIDVKVKEVRPSEVKKSPPAGDKDTGA